MKIGIDLRPLLSKHRTGVGEFTHEFLKHLLKIDRDNEYYLFFNSFKHQESGIRNQELGNNIKFIKKRLPNKFLSSSLYLFGQPYLDKIIDEDLDWFFSPNLHFTSVSKKTKHALMIHDLSFEHFSDCYSYRRQLWHKFIKPKEQCNRADLIFTPSESTRQDVVNTYGIDEEKVEVFYPGLSQIADSMVQTVVKNKYSLPEKFILFLGTLEPRKNIIGLIEAFERSELRNMNYELVIAGAKGWKYEPILKKIMNTKDVHYIGYVDAVDKHSLYAAADLFVYPSLYEGFGFPVLEAMQAGTPVITSNRSSLGEVAGGAAHLVNPLNTDELSRAMSLILSNSTYQDFLINKGRQKATEYNWEKSVNKFLSLIKQYGV